MEIGELLTRGTIWISIVGYAVGSVIFALSTSSPRRRQRDSTVRAVWTVACVSLLVHFLNAFHFYHDWSHAAAYADTARQTKDVTGFNWGGGVFINYAVLLAWMVDIGWWWLSGLDSYRKRPWPVVFAWHGFFIFIIFNATVIFTEGIVRWVGLAISALLILTWLSIATRNLNPNAESVR